MIINEMKLENTVICIHDDCIVPEDKVEEIVSRVAALAYKHQVREKQ